MHTQDIVTITLIHFWPVCDLGVYMHVYTLRTSLQNSRVLKRSLRLLLIPKT